MRELYDYELEILNNRGYTAYSKVKESSNGREYILVKDGRGKRLGARFLSGFNREKKGTIIKHVDSHKRNNEPDVDLNCKQIDTLGDITSLHDTIQKLQDDINNIESRYNLDNLPELKRLDIDILTTKQKSLDNISKLFKEKVKDSESILPDKSTILDIINDIL